MTKGYYDNWTRQQFIDRINQLETDLVNEDYLRRQVEEDAKSLRTQVDVFQRERADIRKGIWSLKGQISQNV